MSRNNKKSRYFKDQYSQTSPRRSSDMRYPQFYDKSPGMNSFWLCNPSSEYRKVLGRVSSWRSTYPVKMPRNVSVYRVRPQF